MSGLTSLITHIGDDKIQFQWLASSLTKLNMKKDVTEVTFVTEHKNLTPDMARDKTLKRVGIVIWMDADDVTSWKESQE